MTFLVFGLFGQHLAREHPSEPLGIRARGFIVSLSFKPSTFTLQR